MRVAPDTCIRKCEWLLRRRVDDHSGRFFPQLAVRRLSILNHCWGGREQGIIECVPGVWILDHLDVLGRLFEPREIRSAWADLNVIVRYPVEHADRMVADVRVTDVGRDVPTVA